MFRMYLWYYIWLKSKQWKIGLSLYISSWQGQFGKSTWRYVLIKFRNKGWKRTLESWNYLLRDSTWHEEKKRKVKGNIVPSFLWLYKYLSTWAIQYISITFPIIFLILGIVFLAVFCECPSCNPGFWQSSSLVSHYNNKTELTFN